MPLANNNKNRPGYLDWSIHAFMVTAYISWGLFGAGVAGWLFEYVSFSATVGKWLGGVLTLFGIYIYSGSLSDKIRDVYDQWHALRLFLLGKSWADAVANVFMALVAVGAILYLCALTYANVFFVKLGLEGFASLFAGPELAVQFELVFAWAVSLLYNAVFSLLLYKTVCDWSLAQKVSDGLESWFGVLKMNLKHLPTYVGKAASYGRVYLMGFIGGQLGHLVAGGLFGFIPGAGIFGALAGAGCLGLLAVADMDRHVSTSEVALRNFLSSKASSSSPVSRADSIARFFSRALAGVVALGIIYLFARSSYFQGANLGKLISPLVGKLVGGLAAGMMVAAVLDWAVNLYAEVRRVFPCETAGELVDGWLPSTDGRFFSSLNGFVASPDSGWGPGRPLGRGERQQPPVRERSESPVRRTPSESPVRTPPGTDDEDGFEHVSDPDSHDSSSESDDGFKLV